MLSVIRFSIRIRLSDARPGEAFVSSIPRGISREPWHEVFAIGVVLATVVVAQQFSTCHACRRTALLPRASSICPTPIGRREGLHTHRHTMSLYFFFLGLSASPLIQQFMVNRWIWLSATSCVPADREPESFVFFFTQPSQLTYLG
jgi:hypothetical protein